MDDCLQNEKLPPSLDGGQLPCVQGWYCSKLDKGFTGIYNKSKYSLIDRFKLFFGFDASAKKRKAELEKLSNTWKLVKSIPQTKSYNLVGDGLFNMGKQYGKRTEDGVLELWENGIGSQKAYFITATTSEPILPSFARNQMGL